MINIIKTAIITIIISIISGLLLERLKNLAPKILCTIGNATPMEMNNKKVCAYKITVSNISNKTIHELTLNVQSSQNNLKISDAKITKGLKFDSLIKDKILDVYIPFLSKGDEFSVTLYVENQYGVHNKPVVIIRSPENFKQVDSVEQKGLLSTLFNIPENTNKVSDAEKTINKENREIRQRNNKPSKNKKAMITIVSIILVMIIGALGKFYFKGMSTNTQTPSEKTDVHKQSTDAKGSVGGTTKNTGTKTSTDGTTKNTGAKTSTDETTKNADTKASTDGTTKNAGTKTSTDGTTKNVDTKTSTDGTNKNTDAKTSTDGTTGNADTKTSTDGATGNTDTKASTGGTTGNKGN